MKKILIVLFLLAFFQINTKLEGVEEPIKTEPVKIIKTQNVKTSYKKEKYVPPTGKALEIATKVASETKYPVDTISRIMFAESHYNSSAIHINKNKSKDFGLFQINSQHFSKAKQMNIDILTDEGNAQFAIYLMNKNGLSDWSFSKHNWQ